MKYKLVRDLRVGSLLHLNSGMILLKVKIPYMIFLHWYNHLISEYGNPLETECRTDTSLLHKDCLVPCTKIINREIFSKKEKGANIPAGHVLEVIFSRENKGAPIPLSFGLPMSPGCTFMWLTSVRNLQIRDWTWHS